MRFRKLKFSNSSRLSGIELDLMNPRTAKPYQTVLLVGENGCGKTSLLNSLERFLYSFYSESECFDYIDYDTAGMNFHGETHKQGRERFFVVKNLSNQKEYSELDFEIKDLMPTDWYPNRSSYYFSRSIGDQKENKQFMEVLQSLSSIQNADVIDYALQNINRHDSPISWDEFFPNSKIYRFARAYNVFFPNLEYFGLDLTHKIGFKKHGNIIPIEELSSGEKQMIKRTTTLLNEVKKMDGSILLLDEPEISIHPAWQARLLDYYKALFTDSTGHQHGQFFIASHSPFLVKEALNADDCVIFRLYENGGIIHVSKIEKPRFLQTITHAEVNHVVFDIASPEYHNQLYCQIGLNIGDNSVSKVDQYIANQPYFHAALHAKSSAYGTKAYKTLSTYIRNAIDHFDNGNSYTEEELRESIKLLQEVIVNS